MIETESVLLEFIALFIQWGLLMESSSVYQRILLFKSFFKAINFRFAPTTKGLQPVTATGIFPPCAIKYHKIRELNGQLVCCVLLP